MLHISWKWSSIPITPFLPKEAMTSYHITISPDGTRRVKMFQQIFFVDKANLRYLMFKTDINNGHWPKAIGNLWRVSVSCTKKLIKRYWVGIIFRKHPCIGRRLKTFAPLLPIQWIFYTLGIITRTSNCESANLKVFFGNKHKRAKHTKHLPTCHRMKASGIRLPYELR